MTRVPAYLLALAPAYLQQRTFRSVRPGVAVGSATAALNIAMIAAAAATSVTP
ncbi:MAG: hypothetical protein M3Z41_05840 [Candidatus Eremiobacteraeota bacterium]|nr:hypothetical protein [Candidatus Eremiobacteraeota bacterium]